MLPGLEFLTLCSFYVARGGGSCEQGKQLFQSRSRFQSKIDWFLEIVRVSYENIGKWNLGKIWTWEETGKFTKHKMELWNVSEPADTVIENSAKESLQ